jgi:hypothetical protein
MLTAIALAAVLGGVPAQPALKLTNVRATVGELGPPRDGNKILPGDVLFFAYDIEGITIDKEGIAKYTMSMEVTDPTGRIILEQKPSDRADFAPLRGNKLPARAFVTVGLDEKPGQYNCSLTVTDPATKAKAALMVKFEVLKKDFGIVAVFTSHDQKGELSAPTSGQVGDTLWIQFTIAAFGRDPKTKQPDVLIEFQFYDEKGNAILVNEKGEPIPRKHQQDGQSFPAIEQEKEAFVLQFPVFLNRPGKFVVEMKATDKTNNKTSTYKLPITSLSGN